MNPVLLTVWAVLAAVFAALLLYRGHLTRYEDEQLFLNEGHKENQKVQQTRIVRRVQQLQPAVRALGGAAALMTVCVVGLYVWDAWKSIH